MGYLRGRESALSLHILHDTFKRHVLLNVQALQEGTMLLPLGRKYFGSFGRSR
jgi:hypothetical protein